MSNYYFSKKKLSEINKLLNFTMENKYSDFYKNKYKNLKLPMTSYDDFKNLPILTKNECLAADFKERIFVDKKLVDRYSFSSGTTDIKKISITPSSSKLKRKKSIADLEFGEQALDSLSIKKILLLWPISSVNMYMSFLLRTKPGTIIIPGDANKLELTAQVAKRLAINAIVAPVSTLTALTEFLESNNFSFEEVLWIFISGENCSTQRMEWLKSIFTNATITSRFGSSETGIQGYQCKYLTNKSNVFHPVPFGIMEINHEQTRDDYNEIIYTTLDPRPFPLIRYQTGDLGTIKKVPCKCGNDFLLKIHGRKGFDVIKIAGVTIYAKLIASLLAEYDQFIEKQFQLHLYEKTLNGHVVNLFEFELSLKKSTRHMAEDSIFIESIANLITEKLQVSNKTTLRDLIEQGSILPVKIKFVNYQPSHEKQRMIITHF